MPWFIFIVPPAMVAAMTAVLSLTGASTAALVAVVTNVDLRRRGYRPGEGHFTSREGSRRFGVRIDSGSENDLCRDLSRLAIIAPDEFKPFSNKRFDATMSEGEFLRGLVRPALRALEDIEAAKVLVLENPGNEEALEVLHDVAERFAGVLHPVVRWMSEFPRHRIKETS
jgi:hypothetical protein